MWLTFIVRKATGTAIPRFSYYNHTSTTWTHGNATGTTGNGTAPGAGGFIITDTTGDEEFDGRVAVMAAWSNELHWTADGSGDSAIEAAGLEDSLQNWVDESPTSLWPFNQASTATACYDMVGDADETEHTGTTVVTGDDPPGFTFYARTRTLRSRTCTSSDRLFSFDRSPVWHGSLMPADRLWLARQPGPCSPSTG